jgi:hypothetical protein
LEEGQENANIDAGLGFIWRISVQTEHPPLMTPVRHISSHKQAAAKAFNFTATVLSDRLRRWSSQITQWWRRHLIPLIRYQRCRGCCTAIIHVSLPVLRLRMTIILTRLVPTDILFRQFLWLVRIE